MDKPGVTLTGTKLPADRLQAGRLAPERGQSAAAPLRGLATHWLRLRYWRKHKRQRQAGRGAAGCEQGDGAQPRLEASAINKIQ